MVDMRPERRNAKGMPRVGRAGQDLRGSRPHRAARQGHADAHQASKVFVGPNGHGVTPS